MKKLAIVIAIVGTGCGIVKVQGLPGSHTTSAASGTANEPAPSADSGANSSASAQPVQAPGERITLDPGFSPNPHRASFVGKTELPLDRSFGVDTKMCDGYVASTAAMVIDAPRGFAHLKISAEGSDILFIKMPGGKYFCQEVNTIPSRPVVDANDWPAGSYEVYVGSSSNGRDIRYSLTIEDGESPVTLPWLAMERPSVSLSGAPRSIFMASHHIDEQAALARHPDHGPRCGDSPYYPESPDLEIKVEKRSTFTLGVRAGATGSMALMGPMTPDGRDIPERCLASWDEKLTLEPGTYYARLGMRKEDRPTVVHYFVRPVEESGAASTLAKEVPEDLAIWERVLLYHMPFLSMKAIRESDELRRELFMTAPKSLFVTVKSDLDENVAKADVTVSSYSGGEKFLDTTPFAFPREGELLLHIDGRGTVLAADGSLFQVRMSDLGPVTSASVPSTARNPQLYFQHALLMAGDDDAGDLQARKKRYEQLEACQKKVWKASSGKLDRLYDYPNLNRDKIARVESDIRGKAYTTCGEAKLAKQDEALWASLEKRRSARRAHSLQEISKRVSVLFGH